MNAKLLVPLTILAILLGRLLIGANARELEVHTPSTRITIADGEDIEIESSPNFMPLMPHNWRYFFPENRLFDSPQTQLGDIPQTTHCERGSIRSQTVETTRSSSPGSYSHSSIRATSCQ